MAFAPFDGVLLDDPRDPIPGAVAMALHHRVERLLAARDKRPVLKPQGLRDRAAACQALLNQGLLPEQLKALEPCGLPLGNPKDPRSLAALARHLAVYLEVVAEQGFLEPAEALWRAAGTHAAGQRGFWVERQPEDGPLEVGLRELAPPWLRALCALSELGLVRFRLATRRGAGRRGLFEGREPHLVRQLLPTLENLAVERSLEHLELDAPEGWSENPWGEALDGLFEGPLSLGPEASAVLRRAILPTEAAVWRSALEQICVWVEAGIAPSDITLIHPDPAAVGPLLEPLLAAEGLALRGQPGRSLEGVAPWGSLLSLLTGLRDLDPPVLAAGLATTARSPLGRSLRNLAACLLRVDQTGELSLQQALEALSEGDRAWVKERWAFLWSLRGKVQPPAAWLADLEALAQRLELLGEPAAFFPVLGLLEEAWASEKSALPFEDILEDLADALAVLRTPTPPGDPGGVRLLAPAALESSWEGARATLLLDLGEGVWPSAPAANPELDWARQVGINRALRAQATAGGGARDFPPHLQTFALPQAEEGEVLPRAFHREAYRFNRVLALTSEQLVALSAERDAEGQRRAQGPFWQALAAAGVWAPCEARAFSHLRWRWEAAEAHALTLQRQLAVQISAPGLEAARSAPEEDRTPDLWRKGATAETPLAPTLLEGLARCPFRVFAERHLNLETWEEKDAHILNLGTLAHHLMEALLAGLEGEAHWPAAFLVRHGLAAPSTSHLLGLFQTCWNARAGSWFAELGPTSVLARERLRLAVEELLPSLAEVLAEDLRQAAPLKEEMECLDLPADLSWRRELAGLEWKLPPRPLALPEGAEVWVHGTLDRVERWVSGDRSFLRILDYKTSRYSTLKTYREDDGAAGAHLQLPLYQAMLEQELELPATALLVSLKEPWKPLPMMLKGEDRFRLLANVSALLTRARAGHFPATPGEHCGTCALAALCGRPVDVEAAEEDEA